jgi:hypothetical protein
MGTDRRRSVDVVRPETTRSHLGAPAAFETNQKFAWKKRRTQNKNKDGGRTLRKGNLSERIQIYAKI